MKRRSLTAILLVAALLVVLFTVLRGIDEAARTGRTLGLSVDDEHVGLTISRVVPGLPADQAGLASGDTFLSLGGASPEALQQLLDIAATMTRGKVTNLTVLRAGERKTVQVTPGVPLPWGLLLLDLFAVLGYLAVALLARFRAPDTLSSRLLSFFSIAVALELALPVYASLIPNWPLYRSVLFHLLSGLQLGLELHLASVIPKRYAWFDHRPWLTRLYYSVGLSAGGITALLEIAEFFEIESASALAVAARAAMNNIVLVGWGLAVVAILMIQFRNSKTPGHRNQALVILTGVLPWAIYNIVGTVASIQDIYLGAWFDLAQPIVLLLYPVVIFIAIFRYHLFDIRVAFKRSLVLVLVTIIVMALFSTVFETLSSRFGEIEQAGRFQVVLFALTMLLLGLLFNPVRCLIQLGIDTRFFPERIAQRERLAELASNLPSLGNLGAIGRHVVEEVSRVFQVTSATLLVSDPASGLLLSLATASDEPLGDKDVSLLLESKDQGIDQLRQARRPLPADILANTSPALAQRISALGAETGIGLVNGETLVGLLLLGPKKDRGALTTEELDLLRLFSLNVATVLENVRLFQSATYEQLTGLLRREAILEALDAEIERASRYERPLTVGMIDLDHFKTVNDTWGHLAGDAMLQRVATELKSRLRSTDQIGRYGGEEFLFFLTETDLETGVRVAEKLRAAIENLPSPVPEAPDLHITASIGLTELRAGTDPPPTANDLIRAADGALLQGKDAGRNRVVVDSDPGV
ncbi:MAG: diguanylate cyclase [Acidobacteriota bacterium]